MFLAGLEVPDRLILDVARCLRGQGLINTSETLEDAYGADREFVH